MAEIAVGVVPVSYSDGTESAVGANLWTVDA
ncbi:Uncharacterised protein [Mycolicibacterium aurum]|uniref:Uncharacterized protein n=1 Tax=Mycolicibacterium aurum TaxID=1791 RepID=A0A3S4U090_MYCAU|nr:Uncharacterised protein [Mycolicibacterium aurum]